MTLIAKFLTHRVLVYLVWNGDIWFKNWVLITKVCLFVLLKKKYSTNRNIGVTQSKKSK